MSDLFHGVEFPKAGAMNRLYYGDNLTIMRGMPTASVDLIYLDPPFNSQRSYNLIYKQLTGMPLPEQEEAFCDAWELDAEKDHLARQMHIVAQQDYDVPDDVARFWEAWVKALRTTQPRLLAYLVYMTYRLFEMRRILRPTGSIYLHCDPAASHYIKIMMDGVFGHGNFRNEICWKRTSAHSSAKRYGPVHDVILFYSRGDTFTWNRQFTPHDPEYVRKFYRHLDSTGRRYRLSDLTAAGVRNGSSGTAWHGIDVSAKGNHWKFTIENLERLDREGRIHWPKKVGGVPAFKRYLDEMPGTALQDVWSDISPIAAQSNERLGYPTQKPLALLERIIKSSSNVGDVVFDPFAGCGTAIYAAHLNKRQWIGCDIAILSVRIVRDVLNKRYGLTEEEHYEISGVPVSMDGAADLFERDKRQFQHWVVELAGGFCNKRQSGDQGVDGRLYFDTDAGLRSMVISVKGGQTVNPAAIREVRGTMEADATAEMAGFICMHAPTKGMVMEAAKAGMFEYQGVRYPRIQIRTVEELLDEQTFTTPARVRTLAWEKQTKLAM